MTFVERLNIDQDSQTSILYDEHIVRYKLVSPLVKNKQVLDIACGSGYGTDILAKAGAAKIIGVDIDKETITNNQQRYQQANIEFKVGDAGKIDLADKSLDIITSFETIEHLPEIEAYLKELTRIIKDDGLVFISTPNIEVSHEKNPWHLKEFTKTEFVELLKKHFPFVKIIEQKNAVASIIKVDNVEQGTVIINDSNGMALYFIALCSKMEIKEDLNNVVSANVMAYERWKNNPGWKLLGVIYRVLQKLTRLR